MTPLLSVSPWPSRTVPSAWSGWSQHLVMRVCSGTRVCGPSLWAVWAAAATCTTCSAWWPCTPMATRWATRWAAVRAVGGCRAVSWAVAGARVGDPRGLRPVCLSQDGSLQCPTCKAIYGEKTGTQPPGKMEFHVIPHSLPGFADTQTIRIVYDIPTGIQVSPADPSPDSLSPPVCDLNPPAVPTGP